VVHLSEGFSMTSRAVPYQVNPTGLVALLPDGRVRFLHPAAKTLIDLHNQNLDRAEPLDVEDFILDAPLVELNQFHLSAPAIAFIETTNLCNLRCTHCYASSGERRDAEMPTERIFRLIDEFAEMGVLQVFLTGGELFAHHDAVEIIRHARTKPFSTQIFSNGLLITEEKLRRIPPGQSFFVSFDTAVPERTVRGRMDFPKLRKCFELIKEHGHVVRTAVSVHRYNINDVEEIFDWCAEHGYARPQWLETHPIGRALLHPHILLTPDQIDEVFAVYTRCMDRYQRSMDDVDEPGEGAQAGAVRRPEIAGIDTIKFCQQLERATGQEKCGRSVAYVNSSGDVYPCSNCMSNNAYKAGNITERPFKEVWDEGFAEFRSIVFDDFAQCKSCAVHQNDIWCQFKCPPLSMNVSGSSQACGATEYLRIFMLRANEYWSTRKNQGFKLHLMARTAR
jgi:radical SAM protein with 4Fe4S-binding SPASM domain